MPVRLLQIFNEHDFNEQVNRNLFFNSFPTTAFACFVLPSSNLHFNIPRATIYPINQKELVAKASLQ